MFTLFITMDKNWFLKPNWLHQGWIQHSKKYVLIQQNCNTYKYFISVHLIRVAINSHNILVFIFWNVCILDFLSFHFRICHYVFKNFNGSIQKKEWKILWRFDMIKCYLLENSFLLQNLYYCNSSICKTHKAFRALLWNWSQFAVTSILEKIHTFLQVIQEAPFFKALLFLCWFFKRHHVAQNTQEQHECNT